ncbi:MAG: PucR family transcriptional regulator [Pseudonocardiaceae bacterium]
MALTVAEVSDRLGPAVVLAQVGHLGVSVTHTLVTDPEYPIASDEGALVVATGYRADTPAFHELIASARDAGAAGIVVKGLPPTRTGTDELAILGVDPRSDWAQLIALIRAATEYSGVSDHPEDSLFGLADAIASLCGGPVIVHDPGWQLLAYSGGDPQDQVRHESILGRRAPAAQLAGLREAGILDRLTRGEVVRIQDGQITGMSRRYAVAVRAGTEPLATIWLMPPSDAQHDEIEQRLRRAADIAALPLLRHVAADPAGSDTGDAAFSALLAGKRTERIVAEQLGLATDAGFVLCGLRATASDEHDRAATARRLLALARSHCTAFRVQAQLAVGVDTTYLVLPAVDALHRDNAVRVVADIHSRLQSSAPHRAVISPTYQSLPETQLMSEQVNDLLELAERRGWAGLTDGDDVQASWRLEQFREVALAHPALLSGPIKRLNSHDREHGTELVNTLRVYFRCVGDIKSVAKAMGLHVNTIRYRLNRAQEIGRFRMDNPDDRLLTELEVRLLANPA